MAEKRIYLTEATRDRLEQVIRWTENFKVSVAGGLRLHMRNSRDGAQLHLHGVPAAAAHLQPNRVLVKLTSAIGADFGAYYGRTCTGQCDWDVGDGALDVLSGLTVADADDVVFLNRFEHGETAHRLDPTERVIIAEGRPMGRTSDGKLRVLGTALYFGCEEGE